MPRYHLILEFDGTAYSGWQRQKNGPSIQANIEEAVFAFSGERVVVHGAGRTDAGVHALGMSAHVDLVRDFEAGTVRDAINFHLRPAPISVLRAGVVGPAFHARFAAMARHYEYRIVNRRAPLALARGHAWRVSGRVDVPSMNEAAQCLVGKHDFTTFRATQCQAASPVKTLSGIHVRRDDEMIFVTCHAPSFLHHQVRSMVGSLVRVGQGAWSAADLNGALVARDRRACGTVAPAEGLYFVRADYPENLPHPDGASGNREDRRDGDLGENEGRYHQGQHQPDDHGP